MGDPTAPYEQEDIEAILASGDDSHGPGDLEALPPSDLDAPDGSDAA